MGQINSLERERPWKPAEEPWMKSSTRVIVVKTECLSPAEAVYEVPIPTNKA